MYKKRGKDVLRQLTDWDEMAGELRDKRSHLWVNIDNVTDLELSILQDKFNFHHLALEDVKHGNQRPKIENYEDHTFIVLNTIDTTVHTKVNRLYIFMNQQFIVTVTRKPSPSVLAVLEKVSQNPDLLKRGCDFLLYLIVDRVIDDMFPLVNELEVELQKTEAQMFKLQTNEGLRQMLAIKHKTWAIRKAIWPMRDLMNVMARAENPFISKKNLPYFRDVYDHVIRQVEIMDTARELTTAAIEGTISISTNNLNIVVKKLTAVGAIIAVPAVIASIYGMNFKYMPELGWEYGYEFALALMLISVVVVYRYFKKQDWL